MSKSLKKQSLKSDKLSSNTFNSKGYTFYGSDHQGKSTQTNVPENSYFGTSKSGGNVIRNYYSLRSHVPIRYNPTDDDINQIVNNYQSYIATNSILASFPYLNPLVSTSMWSEKTTLLLDSKEKVYKYLGKGTGKVNYYKVASPINGTPLLAGNTSTNETNTGLTYTTKPDPNTQYPFNGYIYSGTLVQFVSELNEETGIQETRIIPYQNGRGVPQYSSRYLPNNETPLTEYAPYGELTFTDGTSMSPSLATGITPGHNHACVGMVLDLEGFPAPQTKGPESVKNGNEQGFFTGKPNLSGTYYSPWSRDYAYTTNDTVPVLTSGITTARIGAVYNIALMTYGFRQQISPTDGSWIPIPCIPLFQGERLEAGSIVYSTTKGHIQTPGPYQTQIIEPSISNNQTFTVPNGAIGQTPWDPFADSTWGNIGWTSTPGISFTNIPDTPIATLQVYSDSDGTRETIQGLQQACHGSIIVQCVTTHSPSPSTGNAYFQTEAQRVTQSTIQSDEQLNEMRIARTQLSGISGRGALSQSVPERAQPIGIVLETVIGTGKWEYTSLPFTVLNGISINETNNNTQEDVIVEGGVVYSNPDDTTDYNIITLTGIGSGGRVTWDNYNEYPPFLGTVLPDDITFSVAGVDYVDGDLVLVEDDSLNWTTPTYHGLNLVLTVANSVTELELQSGGHDYVSSVEHTAFNLSLNNGYFGFSEPGSGLPVFDETLSLTADESYFQDFSRYPVGTVFKTIRNETNGEYSRLAYFEVDDYLSYTSKEISLLKPSTLSYGTFSNAFIETEQSNMTTLLGRPTINILSVGSVGEILSFEYIDYGCGNRQGDRMLVIDLLTRNDCVIEFPGLPYGYQEIIATGPGYVSGITYPTESVGGGATVATVETVTDPLVQLPEQSVPIIFDIVTPIGSTELLRLVYNNGLNYVSPRYHSYYVTINATPSDNRPHRGGTGYGVSTTVNNVNTYNLSANTYRGYFNITNQVITGQSVFDYTNDNFVIDSSRYTFDVLNGTEVRLLIDDVNESFQQVQKLVSLSSGIITTSEVKAGGLYPLSDGDYVFQTQRTDQINPRVDIVTDSNGYVRKVKLRDRGLNNRNGDIILILSGDQNAIFQFNDNMEYIDLPPYAKVPGYRVQDDDEAWQRYSDIMSSAVNLLDYQVLIELRESNDQPMENVYPQAAIGSNRAPPSNDMYRNDYNY